MPKPSAAIRAFFLSLGPVEQAQIVSSTAVIVSMCTIVAAMVVTEQEPRLMDFVSVLTIGLIGYMSTYFSLTYGRQMDAQRRQLAALNTIAVAVNRFVTLDSVLRTALDTTADLLSTPFGWIYMLRDGRLTLTTTMGTRVDFLGLTGKGVDEGSIWLHQPRVEREQRANPAGRIPGPLKALGIQFWASIPLMTKDNAVGCLIVAGSDFEMFTDKQAELMEAFGTQISVAIGNAQLFERVRTSEQRYADLFEHSPDIYVNVDRTRTIVECNNTGAAMLGYPKEAVVGRPFEALFAEDRRPALRALVAGMLEEGAVLRDVETQILRADGSLFHVTLNATPVQDARGATAGARIVARDITERKSTEAALLHAQKIDSIGNLAGGIAHDFNNILASILGSASIMRRRMTEEEKLYKYVEIIEGAARRGSSLTRQLLTFARKTETAARTVDVNQLVQDTIALFERSVSKGIVVTTGLSREPVLVSGDEGQIQQAILNLLLNARDAMPDGGTITVATTLRHMDASSVRQFASVKPGLFVQLTVTDSGSGIDRAIQNRIFEPFFTTKDNGTGLGLSVLYGVVQNHGGFVTFESEPGRGTSFTLSFPRSDQPLRAARQERRNRLPRGREHILLMEDEAAVSEIARDALSDLGYTVSLAPDGLAGVEMYKSRQASVDLVLLDMNMPLMGGREAFEQLRALNPHLPIIILTGYGERVVEASAFSGPVNGFMQKPFQIEDLAMRIRQTLDAAATARAERA